MASEILIRGMVCERCIAVIKEGVTNLGHEVRKISTPRRMWLYTTTIDLK